MTDAHKEEAREIAEQWRFAMPRGSVGQLTSAQWDDLERRIASALASRDTEVRQVLEGLRNLNGCWCVVTAGHSESCIRAQVLYEKVQPKESRDANI